MDGADIIGHYQGKLPFCDTKSKLKKSGLNIRNCYLKYYS